MPKMPKIKKGSIHDGKIASNNKTDVSIIIDSYHGSVTKPI